MAKETRFRQRSLARRVCSLGFQGNSRKLELKLLAVYLRDEKKMGVAARRAFLTDFCKKHIIGFHERADHALIDDALKYSGNKANVLVEVDSVLVYQCEFEKMMELSRTIDETKVMFGMLVHKKLDKAVYDQKNPKSVYKSYMSYPGGTKLFSTLAREMRLTKGTNVYKDVLHELLGRNLIQFMPKGNVMLHFFDQLKEGGEVAVRITDFDHIGMYYNYLAGDKGVALCAVCNAAFTRRSNRQVYCDAHKDSKSTDCANGVKLVTCSVCGDVFNTSSKNNHKTQICPLCSSRKG